MTRAVRPILRDHVQTAAATTMAPTRWLLAFACCAMMALPAGCGSADSDPNMGEPVPMANDPRSNSAGGSGSDSALQDEAGAAVDDNAGAGASAESEGALITSGTGDQNAAPRVGLITDGGAIDDLGFNQAAWEGVDQATELLGGEATSIVPATIADIPGAIDELAQAGNDVIVTVGAAASDATNEGAVRYPRVIFLGVGQPQSADAPEGWTDEWPLPNVAGVVFRDEYAGFLAGAMAAHLSTSGTVAAVLGTALDPRSTQLAAGFTAGVAEVDPDATVLATQHPGTLDEAATDADWGEAAAADALAAGADVIFGAGGSIGRAAIVATAAQEGAWCIGLDTDAWPRVPDAHPCLITSAVHLVTPIVSQLIDEAAAGFFVRGDHVGRTSLAEFHDHDAAVTDAMRIDLDRIESGLAAGTIVVGSAP